MRQNVYDLSPASYYPQTFWASGLTISESGPETSVAWLNAKLWRTRYSRIYSRLPRLKQVGIAVASSPRVKTVHNDGTGPKR